MLETNINIIKITQIDTSWSFILKVLLHIR